MQGSIMPGRFFVRCVLHNMGRNLGWGRSRKRVNGPPHFPKIPDGSIFRRGGGQGDMSMKGIGFATVLIALSPFHARAQDYANATNAAWCAGALGAYSRPSEPGATYLDQARSRHFAFAKGFFGTSGDNGATMLIFENLGSAGAADCNRACAAQEKSDVRVACFDRSPECKRIIACLTDQARADPLIN
jgi:hypothetical protein